MRTPKRSIIEEAKDLSKSSKSWADFTNALFDPINGLITKAYPNKAERTEFMRSDDYKRIRELLGKAMDTHGVVEGATPKKSGRFVVRLPESLHLALEREAEREGVSLNQLVVAKLATQLSSLVGEST